MRVTGVRRGWSSVSVRLEGTAFSISRPLSLQTRGNWFRLLVETSCTNIRSMAIRKGYSATRAKDTRWEQASSSFRTNQHNWHSLVRLLHLQDQSRWDIAGF